MGKYLNPGNMKFRMVLNSEIFVDKTGMIFYINSVINTEQRFVCVSRPRRFGKTITANMLAAYYGKGECRKLFADRKIAEYKDWDRYLNHFDVIRVVMTDFIKEGKDVKESLEKMQKLVIRDIKMQYPDIDYYDTDNLIQSMSDVYEESGNQFVIIIDEWDAVFRACKDDKNGQKLYLDFLRDWLKDQEYIALAYMTGILPIKKYGQHSALNMFDEYSIITPMQLAPYTGFTDEKVKHLCEEYHMYYEDIASWYNGYVVNTEIPVAMRTKYKTGEYKERKISIYSPQIPEFQKTQTGIML